MKNSNFNTTENLLPQDGTANYYGKVIPQHSADAYFTSLLNTIEWKHDTLVIYGKKITTKRKTAWYGDKPYKYTYSNTTKQALPWTNQLLELKQIAEQISGESFNTCLLNLYHNGSEAMGWHSDNEKDLKQNAAIASIGLGAERKFALKHKQNKQTIAMILQHGSLLIMKDTVQTHWQHRLPPTKKITAPRINLTFRMIGA